MAKVLAAQAAAGKQQQFNDSSGAGLKNSLGSRDVRRCSNRSTLYSRREIENGAEISSRQDW
jgi:hypothetical protein